MTALPNTTAAPAAKVETLREYQEIAHSTAIYPADNALGYLLPGIYVEAGELWDLVASDIIGEVLPEFLHNAAIKEAGDCLWFAAEIHTALGEVLEFELPPALVPMPLQYLAKALMYYARKIADIWVKTVRDDGGILHERQRAYVLLYSRFIIGYVKLIAQQFGLTLIDVAQRNADKLASRQARGVLGGSGDNR